RQPTRPRAPAARKATERGRQESRMRTRRPTRRPDPFPQAKGHGWALLSPSGLGVRSGRTGFPNGGVLTARYRHDFQDRSAGAQYLAILGLDRLTSDR